MKLQDILKILNLNSLWKDSTEYEKITAINQVLNDLVILGKAIYTEDPTGVSLQVDKYQNVTYRYLNETLGLELKEEDILALFQYSIMDFTNDVPLKSNFKSYPEKKNFLKVSYSTSYKVRTPIVTGNLPDYKEDLSRAIFTITQMSTYKVKDQVHAFDGQPFNIELKTSYKVRNPFSTSLINTIGYSSTFNIIDPHEKPLFVFDYLPTYLII